MMVPIHGESRVPAIVISTTVLLALASIFVLARIYSRAWLLRRWEMEDYLVVFSWLLAIALTIMNCVQTAYGLGHHQNDIPLPAFAVTQKLAYINLLLYTVVVCTTKLSICYLYLPIFQVEKRTMWLVRGCIWFVILYSMIFELVSIFQCHPVHAFWDFSARLKGSCINTIPSFYASGACNIVSDIWLMALVVPKIKALQIRKGQKIALLGIVSLGWLVVVASIVRLVRLSTILHAPDKAWASYDINIWTSVEINVGIICASAPTIKPVLAKIMPWFLTDLPSGSRTQSYSTKHYRSSSYPATGPARGSRDAQQSHSMTALASKGREEVDWIESREETTGV